MERPWKLMVRTRVWSTVLSAIDEAAQASRSSLFFVQGVAGTGRNVLLEEAQRVLEARNLEVRRAELLGGSRMHSGTLAELLEITERPPGDRVGIVVQEAQWSDATSVGHLRRLLASDATVVAVFGFAPPPPDVAIVFERLAQSAELSGAVHRIELSPLTSATLEPIADPELADLLTEGSGGDPAELLRLLDDWERRGILDLSGDRVAVVGTIPEDRPVHVRHQIAELPPPERRLVEAAALSGAALPVGVAARLLEGDEDRALEVGERLARQDLLRDTPQGFAPPDGERAEHITAGLGRARRSATYGKLADAFMADPTAAARGAEIARFLFEAGRAAEALPRLADAGIGAVAGGALPEALPLLDDAISAYEAAGDDPALEGRLHLARAQVYRFLGWSQRATEDADVATRRLTGTELVDAYGWAAALADDRQQVQEAERLLAAGEYVAAASGELGKLGSLLTLRARVLGRLGFGDEAEAAAARGEAILAEYGTAPQRTRALYNRAWIDFDQGRMAAAEARFADLVARFRDDRADSQVADAQAWRARTLMYAGRPDEGLAAAAEAVDIAGRGGEVGPVFLAALARTNGASLHGAGEEGLAAGDELLAIVLQQLPQWENAARYFRAQALLALGRLEEAAEEADRAILACPEGVDGDPWRLRCRVLAMRISSARREPWPAQVADELTEELLTRRWNLSAAFLLAERARQEEDPEFARQGAALALQLGVPMVAALNAAAGDLWSETTGTAVAAAVRSLAAHIPDAWEDAWRSRPEVAAALAVPEPSPLDAEAAIAELRDNLERAFQEAGLAGAENVLSPAQRRAAGIRIRRRRRRRPLWQVALAVGGGLAVAAVAVVALLLALDQPEPEAAAPVTVTVPPVTITVTAPTVPTTVTTTTLPPVSERQLPAPEQQITAQWGYRGERPVAGPDRPLTGVADVSAVRQPGGFYFRETTNDPITATPVVRGRNLFLGNLNGSFFVFETDGDLVRTLSPETGRRIFLPATAELIGSTAGSEAARLDAVFFGDTEGRLHAADAGSGLPLPGWDATTGGPVSTAPLVAGDLVLVGSSDGYVHAFDLAANGALVWRFPGEESDIGPSQPVGGMAYVDGIVYVVRQDGSLYGLDPATGDVALDEGRPICDVGAGGLQGEPAGNPVVAGGHVYVAAGSFIWRFDATDCGIPTTVAFITGSEASAAPALDLESGALFQPIGRFVLRYDVGGDLPVQSHTCQYPQEGGRVDIESAPSIARPGDGTSIVYFGDNEGILHAIDGETCEELWQWPTGGAISSSPALGDDVVIVTSQDGTVTAIGPAAGQ